MLNEEISLFDIWKVMYQRRWVFACLAMLFMGLSTAFIVWKSRIKTYQASFRGTQTISGSNYSPIFNSNFVLATFQTQIIPNVMKSIPKTQASIMQNTLSNKKDAKNKPVPISNNYILKITGTHMNQTKAQDIYNQLILSFKDHVQPLVNSWKKTQENNMRQLAQENDYLNRSIAIHKQQLVEINHEKTNIPKLIPQHMLKPQQISIRDQINEIAITSEQNQQTRMNGSLLMKMQIQNQDSTLSNQKSIINNVDHQKQIETSLMSIKQATQDNPMTLAPTHNLRILAMLFAASIFLAAVLALLTHLISLARNSQQQEIDPPKKNNTNEGTVIHRFLAQYH